MIQTVMDLQSTSAASVCTIPGGLAKAKHEGLHHRLFFLIQNQNRFLRYTDPVTGFLYVLDYVIADLPLFPTECFSLQFSQIVAELITRRMAVKKGTNMLVAKMIFASAYEDTQTAMGPLYNLLSLLNSVLPGLGSGVQSSIVACFALLQVRRLKRRKSEREKTVENITRMALQRLQQLHDQLEAFTNTYEQANLSQRSDVNPELHRMYQQLVGVGGMLDQMRRVLGAPDRQLDAVQRILSRVLALLWNANFDEVERQMTDLLNTQPCTDLGEAILNPDAADAEADPPLAFEVSASPVSDVAPVSTEDLERFRARLEQRIAFTEENRRNLQSVCKNFTAGVDQYTKDVQTFLDMAQSDPSGAIAQLANANAHMTETVQTMMSNITQNEAALQQWQEPQSGGNMPQVCPVVIETIHELVAVLYAELGAHFQKQQTLNQKLLDTDPSDGLLLEQLKMGQMSDEEIYILRSIYNLCEIVIQQNKYFSIKANFQNNFTVFKNFFKRVVNTASALKGVPETEMKIVRTIRHLQHHFMQAYGILVHYILKQLDKQLIAMNVNLCTDILQSIRKDKFVESKCPEYMIWLEIGLYHIAEVMWEKQVQRQATGPRRMAGGGAGRGRRSKRVSKNRRKLSRKRGER